MLRETTTFYVRALGRSQPLRFVLVGGFNTLVGYLIYAFLVAVGLVPEFALGTATVVGAIFNYFSTGGIVFGHRSLSRLPHFLAVYLALYVLNALALRWLINVGLSPFISQAVLLPVVASASFLCFRHLIFRPER